MKALERVKTKTEEQIKVMQAYLNGSVIEVCRKDDNWVYSGSPSWDWLNFNYRIKKEPNSVFKRSPKLIPFTIKDDLVGKIVKQKGNSIKMMIVEQDIINVSFAQYFITYQSLLDNYEFLDGSPCGKLE